MEIRSLLLLVAAVPAVVGFQAAMRVGPMKPAIRAPSTAMLLDPAMLDPAMLDTTAIDAPMQLLALKTEADEVLDEVMGAVFPLGTAGALAVRHQPLLVAVTAGCLVSVHSGCLRLASLNGNNSRPPKRRSHIAATHAPRRAYSFSPLHSYDVHLCTLHTLAHSHLSPLLYQLIVKGLVDDQLKVCANPAP